MAFDRTYRGPVTLREALTASSSASRSTVGVSVRTVRRLMGFDVPDTTGWGDLGKLIGSSYIAGRKGVTLVWEIPDKVMSIVYFEGEPSNVTRFVRARMTEQPGRLEFGDRSGVRRGMGTIELNGAAWFFEDPTGRVSYAVATGAIYSRKSDTMFERQRFSCDGTSVMLEKPDQYTLLT